MSDERAAEIRAARDKARLRQRSIDQQNGMLWRRWAYAVCLGCASEPGTTRVPHTNPMRVLAGIPAAQDDARELAGRRRI